MMVRALGEEHEAAGRDGDGFHLCSVLINQYTDWLTFVLVCYS